MKKSLLLGIILTACIIIVAFVFAQVYPVGMISYWKFDEDSGTTASDSVDANHGTIYGAARTAGQVDGALSFDGSDDYVRVPDHASLDFGPGQDFSLEAWIRAKPDQADFQGTILAKLNAPGQPAYKRTYGYSLMVRGMADTHNNEGKIGVWLGDGTGTGSIFQLYSVNTYDDDTWHHVVATIDRDSLAVLYIDGSEVNNADVSSLSSLDESNSENLEIGREGVYDQYWFKGLIDEVAIYDRALLAEEIQHHYENGLNGLGYEVECVPPPAGLVSWWDGDDVSGTDAFDIQDGNDGTLVNGATTVPGKVGDAFSFDGTGDYLEIADDPSLTMGTGDLTVAAWVKISDNTHNNRFVDTGARQNEGYSIFYYSPGSFGLPGSGKFIVQWHTSGVPKDAGPNRQSVGGMDIGDGNWHYVAGVWDRDTAVKAYVDGVLVGSAAPKFASSELIANAFDLRIGSEAAAVRQLTNGLIDEVQIFNRALTGEEILYEFLAGSLGKCKELVNQPPVALCQDIEISVDENCPATITVDDVNGGSYDPDGDSITISVDNLGPFFPGVHLVNLTVTDENEASATCQASVTVIDTTPPEISVLFSPSILRPPNHKMVLVVPTITVSDNCGSDPEYSLISITMNEGDETLAYDPDYDSTLGDGHTINDIQVDGNGNIYLRAERSGKGDGRIYTITYTATDESGNSTTATANVTVPHDQKKP